MSYLTVFQALEPGDVVTFNDSGNANTTASPELYVGTQTNAAVIKLYNDRTVWRVVNKSEQGYLLQYDRNNEIADREDYRTFDVIETIELVGES